MQQLIIGPNDMSLLVRRTRKESTRFTSEFPHSAQAAKKRRSKLIDGEMS